MFRNDPLIFEPGPDWSYTSFGDRILACVMGGASGKKVIALIGDSISKKSNIKNTAADDAWEIIPNRVSGYRLYRKGEVRRAGSRDVGENLPAGGYLSTASDLVRFAPTFSQYLLSPKGRAVMASPVAVDDIGTLLDTLREKTWRDAMPNKDWYGYGIIL